MSDAPAVRAASNAEIASGHVTKNAFEHDVVRNLICRQARYPDIATPQDWYMALAFSVRDRMLARWAASLKTYASKDAKVACYSLAGRFQTEVQRGVNV